MKNFRTKIRTPNYSTDWGGLPPPRTPPGKPLRGYDAWENVRKTIQNGQKRPKTVKNLKTSKKRQTRQKYFPWPPPPCRAPPPPCRAAAAASGGGGSPPRLKNITKKNVFLTKKRESHFLICLFLRYRAHCIMKLTSLLLRLRLLLLLKR